jgi:hypothetical protein
MFGWLLVPDLKKFAPGRTDLDIYGRSISTAGNSAPRLLQPFPETRWLPFSNTAGYFGRCEFGDDLDDLLAHQCREGHDANPY